MQLIPHDGGANTLLENPVSGHGVGLAWLGQAGFAVRFSNYRLLIDPYLSDHLAKKYAGKEFPHTRMMPPPVSAGDIRNLDLILCSHRHGDHTDPGSLPTLARNNPRCRFIVPRAELAPVMQIGLEESRLIPANTGERLILDKSVEIHVIPSAHETLKTNAAGEHHFLGFILRFDGITVYHSGDCVVYDGLAEQLRKWRIDLALLPVNGRSEFLSLRGVAGNMTFDEARDLCLAAGIRLMIPHHFGMFDFNTVDPVGLRQQVARSGTGQFQGVLPEVNDYYTLA